MIPVTEILLPTVSGATTQTSNGLSIEYMFGYSVQAVFTGTLVGTATLQGSDDTGRINTGLPPIGTGVVTWNEVANSSQAVTGAGQITWNVRGANYRWIRFVYTATSGTGNVTVTVNAKGI